MAQRYRTGYTVALLTTPGPTRSTGTFLAFGIIHRKFRTREEFIEFFPVPGFKYSVENHAKVLESISLLNKLDIYLSYLWYTRALDPRALDVKEIYILRPEKLLNELTIDDIIKVVKSGEEIKKHYILPLIMKVESLKSIFIVPVGVKVMISFILRGAYGLKTVRILNIELTKYSMIA